MVLVGSTLVITGPLCSPCNSFFISSAKARGSERKPRSGEKVDRKEKSERPFTRNDLVQKKDSAWRDFTSSFGLLLAEDCVLAEEKRGRADVDDKKWILLPDFLASISPDGSIEICKSRVDEIREETFETDRMSVDSVV
ncbi:hypothetical protein F2P81_007409 [Scophthalmus maximus]|uniref:Uncharacterized protein n=1 Tax=Scophthalmus maximus TaxID=52904 RepID=A0A6A4TF80_SCOMX|nr:hypothetical protein F2P81_007409 [Scophthalmus maximus]